MIFGNTSECSNSLKLLLELGHKGEKAEMNVLSLKLCRYHNLVFSWIMSIRINYTSFFLRSLLYSILGIVLGNNLISLKFFTNIVWPYIYYLLTLFDP